jgi:hypothetical protein
MSCSEGCALLFHYPTCWHNFKEGYRVLEGNDVEDVVLKGKVGVVWQRYDIVYSRSVM